MAIETRGKSSLRTAQKDMTRRRILDAARELFRMVPLDQVSMEDVAKAAVVGRTTIYFHYATRNALLIDLLREDWDRQASLFERVSDRLPVDRAGLRAWLKGIAAGMRRSQKFLRLYSYALSISEDFQELLYQHRERLVATLAKSIPAFVPHGSPTMEMRKAATESHMMIVQIEYFGLLMIGNPSDEEGEAATEVMLDTLCRFIEGDRPGRAAHSEES